VPAKRAGHCITDIALCFCSIAFWRRLSLKQIRRHAWRFAIFCELMCFEVVDMIATPISISQPSKSKLKSRAVRDEL